MSSLAEPTVDALLERLRAHGLSLPETVEAFPWGESVLKVRKKVFVFLGQAQGERLGLSVKLPETAEDVLCMPFATPTGYGLGRAKWVSLSFAADALPAWEDLEAWVEESYRAVAPRTLVRALDRQRAGG